MTLRRRTFDTFATSQCNRIAYAASKTVAEAPGSAFNPLFIFGSHGAGKTHLLDAIAHHAECYLPSAEVARVSGADLAGDSFDETARFRTAAFESYGPGSLLLIDDLQKMQGDNQIQAALLQELVPLCYGGCQVVIASTRPPRDFSVMSNLPLVTKRSLVLWVQPPTTDVMLDILRRQGISLDVALELIRRPDQNVSALLDDCELAGIYAASVGEPVTVELIRRALGTAQ